MGAAMTVLLLLTLGGLVASNALADKYKRNYRN
jgi:hypothetical protein